MMATIIQDKKFNEILVREDRIIFKRKFEMIFVESLTSFSTIKVLYIKYLCSVLFLDFVFQYQE